MYIIVAFFISLLYSIFLLPAFMEFIRLSCEKQLNYRGKAVYKSAGIIFIPLVLLLCTSYVLYSKIVYNTFDYSSILFLTAAFSAAFTGYIDDNADEKIKGISGHGKQLLKGSITSGSIKALTGVLVSIIISLWKSSHGIDILTGFLTICLMQNFINIMDLRPGRAIKVYTLLAFIIFPFIGVSSIYASLNMGIILMLLFYFHYEADEICLMGDAGSNVLGILLGITAASSYNMAFRICMLVFLLSIQVYAEKRSISTLIEHSTVLNYIDKAGRIDDDKD